MQQGHSCGSRNISLGELIVITDTTADEVSSNHVPWIVIGVCQASCMALLFSIRLLLARENKRRDLEPLDDTFDDVYVISVDEVGNRVECKVPKVRSVFVFSFKFEVIFSTLGLIQFRGQEFLDLTDRQNRDFRYVL
jgi:hypothetical protein